MDVSTISISQAGGGRSSGDSLLQLLEKQKKEINKEISKELMSEDDEKTKEEKVKILQTRLQLIELQIAAEKAKKKSKQGDEEKQEDDGKQNVQNVLKSALEDENSSIDIVA